MSIHAQPGRLRRLLLVTSLACVAATSPARASGQTVAERRDSIDVGDCTLHYRVAGRGFLTALVLSGGPGSSADYLLPVQARLARTTRAVLLDQRGTGSSTLRRMDSTTLKVRRAVDDIEAVRVRLGASRVVLVGHSWGGALAMAYAAVHPEHVSALVLVGSAALDGGPGFARAVGEHLAERLTRADRDSIRRWAALETDPSRHRQALAQLARLDRKAYLSDPRNDAAVERSKATTTMNATVLRVMLADLARTGHALDSELTSAARASAPPMRVLVLFGDADVIGESSAPEIRAAIPTAEVRVIPHSGHYPWIEAPEAFYDAVNAFLATLRR